MSQLLGMSSTYDLGMDIPSLFFVSLEHVYDMKRNEQLESASNQSVNQFLNNQSLMC